MCDKNLTLINFTMILFHKIQKLIVFASVNALQFSFNEGRKGTMFQNTCTIVLRSA